MTTKEIWVLHTNEKLPADLAALVLPEGWDMVPLSIVQLESPQWQLDPPVRPGLVFVDGRSVTAPPRRAIPLFEEWLILLRERLWDSPVFLVLSSGVGKNDLCHWGRYGATGVLVDPRPEDTARAVADWSGKSDPGRGKDDIPLLSILRETGAMLSVERSTPALWKRFLRHLLKQFAARTGSIFLLSDEGDELIPLAAVGLPPEVLERGRLPLAGSITSRVIHEDKALLLQGDLKRIGVSMGERRSRPVSALAVPLRFGDRVLGSLNVSRSGPRARPFRRNALLALEVVGAQVAQAVMNFRLLDIARENERLAVVGRTTADISHCVKNILTGLLGSMFLLEKGYAEHDEAMLDESLLLLKRSVGRLNLMIGDLLDFSKPREPDPEPCCLRDVFEEVRRQIHYRCEQQQVEMRQRVPGDMPVVMAEENRLFRALMNLAGNALDAMPSGGRMKIGARWEADGNESERKPGPEHVRLDEGEALLPGRLHIEIADTGPGVPEAIREKIFEGFFSTKGSHGTGLGLAMVRKFVEESGGEIEVRNAKEGGAVFVLILPAAAIVSAQPEAEE